MKRRIIEVYSLDQHPGAGWNGENVKLTVFDNFTFVANTDSEELIQNAVNGRIWKIQKKIEYLKNELAFLSFFKKQIPRQT